MDELIRARGNDILFDEHLDPVSHRLKEAERPNSIRAVTVLNPAQDLALEDGNQSEQGEKYAQNPGDVNKHRRDLNHQIRRAQMSQPRQKLLFQTDEYLVQKA